MGKPEAQEKLESFRKERKDLVDSIIEVGPCFIASVPLSAHVWIRETELRRI